MAQKIDREVLLNFVYKTRLLKIMQFQRINLVAYFIYISLNYHLMHLKMTSTLIRAIKKIPINPNDYWYDPVPMGENKLSCPLSEMRVEDEFEQYKRNHSLCATGASALSSAGVSEKNYTGNRSLEALQLYEHVSSEHSKNTSKILTGLNISHEPQKKIPPTEPQSTVGATSGNFSSLFYGCTINSISVHIGKRKIFDLLTKRLTLTKIT